MSHNNTTTVPGIRLFLLTEGLSFVRTIRALPGVRRVAMVGSLLTDKADPKDIDFLVTVEDSADLAPLAAAGRKLKGRTQSRNTGADIFLANPEGAYLGRICHWRECRPGIRAACDARHCGARHYLHDDLDDLSLPREIVEAPPLELWPEIIPRVAFPSDLTVHLIQKLEQDRSCAHEIGCADEGGASVE
jgi:hypothetical protein